MRVDGFFVDIILIQRLHAINGYFHITINT